MTEHKRREKILTKFSNAWNIESGDKLFPDLWSQPIPEHDPNFVLAFLWYNRCCQQVTTNLANVLRALKYRETNHSSFPLYRMF